MKFILTGCTGFIGSAVLSRCLAEPKITSVIALSRRALPDSVPKDPKLKVVLMKDFKTYDESVIKELEGADGCIWCMGTTAGIRELEVDYPLALATAISKTLSSPTRSTPFRYLHLSGMATERNQSASLWFKSEMRKMKGQNELNMLQFAKDYTLWETLIVKAGWVFDRTDVWNHRTWMGSAMGDKSAIGRDELAEVMVDAVMNGWTEDEVNMSNQYMVTKARELAAKRKREE